ncbi:MAG: MFS transporter, partial [Gemmatimonadales bacterium]
ALIALAIPPFAWAVALRFITGMAIAGVYPVGMKIVASWTTVNRGLAIGILVGALTVGSASPHLIAALQIGTDWRATMIAASLLAAVGALVAFWAGGMGPHTESVSRFEWKKMTEAVTVRPLRLANGGYLGHMWELYAMWAWIGVFAAHSLAARHSDLTGLAPLVAFAAIGMGGPASVIAGRLADRYGRTTITTISMAISGSCCILAGFVFGAAPWVLFLFVSIWGFAIVADSAQFSTAVSELADTRFVGTQLTAQTAMGFLLTVASIQLMPILADIVSWRWTFAILALGPAAGIISMLRLRRDPASVALAHGRR